VARFDTSPGCTNTKLHRLVRTVRAPYETELRKVGLRTTQFWLLMQLVEIGPARPSDLAAAMMLDASTLTRKIRPLLAAGWVALKPGEDGRSRNVSITAAGRAKLLEGERCWVAAEAHLQELFGDTLARLDAAVEDCLHALPPAS
jgi:DNA-binding MarR family transcriptional regulator